MTSSHLQKQTHKQSLQKNLQSTSNQRQINLQSTSDHSIHKTLNKPMPKINLSPLLLKEPPQSLHLSKYSKQAQSLHEPHTHRLITLINYMTVYFAHSSFHSHLPSLRPSISVSNNLTHRRNHRQKNKRQNTGSLNVRCS